ncbi:MAG: TrmH family RNA methyltransferase, partial [Christensenellales bacterium]
MKEITSVHNAAAQLLRELQKSKARREHGLFVCESAKMVGEAVALHLAQTLFVEKGREAEYAQMAAQAESMGCALYVVSQAVMQAVSTAKTPQGVVCTAKIPEPPKTLTGKRIVALDGVQDPGNVG